MTGEHIKLFLYPCISSLPALATFSSRQPKFLYNWLPINLVWLVICHPLACWRPRFVDLQMTMFYYYYDIFFLMRRRLN